MLAQVSYDNYAMKYSRKREVENYARVLYNNYRVRSGQKLPIWSKASAYIRKEFRREARQELGY